MEKRNEKERIRDERQTQVKQEVKESNQREGRKKDNKIIKTTKIKTGRARKRPEKEPAKPGTK